MNEDKFTFGRRPSEDDILEEPLISKRDFETPENAAEKQAQSIYYPDEEEQNKKPQTFFQKIKRVEPQLKFVTNPAPSRIQVRKADPMQRSFQLIHQPETL